MAEYTSAKAGLFYPHIHFRSREWLRSSILYYDKLSRIVPRGVPVDRVHWYGEFMTHSQAEEIVRDVDALKANGFLNDESPEAILSEVSQEFSAFLETALSNSERRAKLLPALSDDESFYSIHPAKIDHTLQQRLWEMRLLHQSQDDDYSDIKLEPVTAAFYMLHLANKMAGRLVIRSSNPPSDTDVVRTSARCHSWCRRGWQSSTNKARFRCRGRSAVSDQRDLCEYATEGQTHGADLARH